MKNKIILKNRIILKILGFSFLCFFLFIFFLNKTNFLKEKKEENILKVETKKASKISLKKLRVVSAEVEAVKSLDLKSRVAGRIKSFPIEISSEIKKGDIVVFLDTKEFEIKLKQAEALRDIAISKFEIAKEDFKEKRKDKIRMKNLFEKGSITKKRFDSASLFFEMSKSKLAIAKANLNLAKAKYEEAKYFFDESFIKAPFSGIISFKYLNEGDLVSPSSPIVRMINEEFKIIAKVPEKYLSKIKEKDEVEIFLENSKKSFFSKIFKIYPEIDKFSKNATLEIRIKNKKIYPGSYAKIVILLDKKDVIAVPISSLIDKNKIFVIKENRAFLKNLKLGRREEDLIEVKSNLLEGEEIVISGQHKLKDGKLVKR